MSKKYVFNKINLQVPVKGFKIGYETPTLPLDIIEFTNKPLIIILRFTGGVSFLATMSNSYLHYPLWFLAILTFFTIIFTIYRFYLSYHRCKHIRYLLKSGAYDVRKSPLDRQISFLSGQNNRLFKRSMRTSTTCGFRFRFNVRY